MDGKESVMGNGNTGPLVQIRITGSSSVIRLYVHGALTPTAVLLLDSLKLQIAR